MNHKFQNVKPNIKMFMKIFVNGLFFKLCDPNNGGSSRGVQSTPTKLRCLFSFK